MFLREEVHHAIHAVHLSMCTLVVLRRPGSDWPVLVAANRDESLQRPWRPPGRHWPDRPHVVGGYDEMAEGTWLALNDFGVVAAMMNRRGTLGQAPGKRSRGELVLEALDHADASEAAIALADLNAGAYRGFNMVVADNRDAYWLANRENDSGIIEIKPLPVGLSMLTAGDRNDPTSPRISHYLPKFEAATAPDPGAGDSGGGDWSAWEALMASRGGPSGPLGDMCVVTDTGFGTLSSSLIALPASYLADSQPIWRFAAGRPDEAPYNLVDLA
jgi:hypothetical protein